ncbi:homoserine O-succinyltransferase [Geminicoccus roseus]|uniref:homoserine O-succinyltransferase n=1 Tax=Geminicoccus roseus TaxID=404900 RepID=UPI0004801AF0|nr:homoserine O-succinyltransferase [Geminicoccus roseus]
MPIKIPNDLPAAELLRNEGVRLIGEEDALQQDIRPMQVGLLNLMPDKLTTETQFARLLGATPLQVELTLISTGSYVPSNVSQSHLQSFYRSWEQVADRKFDGLLITGAPVELLEFEQVKYWDELAQIFEWSRTHVHSTFNVCWGAQAALYHFHHVPKHTLPQKRFGIFRHEVTEPRDAARSPLMRGFDDEFWVPVSRHTEVREEDLPTDGSIRVLARSTRAGLCLCEDPVNRHLFMFNHLEYDTFTLDREYRRDLERGAPIEMPLRYYPDDDLSKRPVNRWRAYAHLLFGNWINEMYQTTPFELEQIGT